MEKGEKEEAGNQAGTPAPKWNGRIAIECLFALVAGAGLLYALYSLRKNSQLLSQLAEKVLNVEALEPDGLPFVARFNSCPKCGFPLVSQ